MWGFAGVYGTGRGRQGRCRGATGKVIDGPADESAPVGARCMGIIKAEDGPPSR